MKNLFILIEAKFSSHFDGFLHSNDFKQDNKHEMLDHIPKSKYEGMAIMFEQFGRTFDDNQIKKLGVKTPKPPRGGELTLSFMDFMAGMLAYNKQDFVTQADLNMVYDILADDNENPHLTRQQLYDCIRNSVENADDDIGFITEFNQLIDDRKMVLGIPNKKQKRVSILSLE
jgi:hypothetical protein